MAEARRGYVRVHGSPDKGGGLLEKPRDPSDRGQWAT